jgi:DNA-binding GntR family transcriptional regulator
MGPGARLADPIRERLRAAILKGAASSQPLTEQEAADQDVRFHDAIYRAAHHERLYVAWSSIRSQVYVLLLARNVAGPDFREDTYSGHLELTYLIRARNEERVVTAIENHLAASYARVRASQPLGPNRIA